MAKWTTAGNSPPKGRVLVFVQSLPQVSVGGPLGARCSDYTPHVEIPSTASSSSKHLTTHCCNPGSPFCWGTVLLEMSLFIWAHNCHAFICVHVQHLCVCVCVCVCVCTNTQVVGIKMGNVHTPWPAVPLLGLCSPEIPVWVCKTKVF